MKERNSTSMTLEEAQKEIGLTQGDDFNTYQLGETTLLINLDKSLTIIAPARSGPQPSHIIMHNSSGMDFIKGNIIYAIRNEEGHLEISKIAKEI